MKRLTDYERRVLERTEMDLEYLLSFVVEDKDDSIAYSAIETARKAVTQTLKDHSDA